MNEQIKELLDAVQRTADQVGATAADAFACAEKKAGALLSVGKLNIQLADQKAQVNVLLREVGEMVYGTHTGAVADSEELLNKLQEIDQVQDQVRDLTAELARLRAAAICPACGAAARPGDRFCRDCGAKL